MSYFFQVFLERAHPAFLFLFIEIKNSSDANYDLVKNNFLELDIFQYLFTGLKLLGKLFIRNVTKKLDQIGDKFCKFRSCSLGQRGLSASLLDLHEKTLDRVNENIDEIVTKSIKSMKTFTSLGKDLVHIKSSLI